MMWWLFPVMIVCLHIHIISSVNLEDFYIAARTGDVETISTMLSTGIITNVHKRDSKGNTAFIVAAGRGQTGVLQYLLSQGAQIEDSTKGGLLGGKTALCWSASQGRELAVSFLLEAGANPNHATEDGVFLGKTPLMWASSQGKAGVVQILINSGADIDYASQGGNFKGKTSLMWASSQGRVEATLRLLEAGASVDLVDVDGVSALMWATGSEGDNDGSHNKGLFEKALKGHNDVVKTLLLYGATIDTRDKDGITALMYAAFHGHVDAVQTLINAGADMSVKNNAGKTALYLADSSGHANVVQVLRQGPNIHNLPWTSLLETSICGWILSLLRRTEGGIHFAHIRPTRYNVSTSCRHLDIQGLNGNLGLLVEMLETTHVEEVIEHLAIPIFAARALAKHDLILLLNGTRSEEACLDNYKTVCSI